MSHMSDYQKFGVTKLSHDNYFIWKEKARFLLSREGLWSVVINPPPTDPTQAWIDKNDIALATIGLLISDRYLTDIKNITSAHTAWTTLRSLHESSSIGSRLVIYKRLFGSKFNMGQNMEEYIQIILENAARLEDTGHPLDQEVLGALLLSNLPREFDPLVTSLEGRKEETLSLGYLREKIIEENNKFDKRSTGHASGTKVLYAQGQDHRDEKPRNISCYYCHKVGHIRRDCRLLNRHSAHNNLEQTNKYIPQQMRTQTTPQEHSKYTLDNTPEDPLFGDTRPTQKKCQDCQTKDETKYEKALSVNRGEEDMGVPWILDSGSFAHLCKDRAILESYRTLENPIPITSAGGSNEQAVGSGTYEIRVPIPGKKTLRLVLKNVLHVPQLNENLISITQLNSEGWGIFFGGGKAWIRVEGEKHVIGELKDNLYVHLEDYRPPPNRAYLCVHGWHDLLGHRNHKDIRDMGNMGLTEDLKITPCNCNDFCATCEISKKPNKKFKTREAQDIEQPFKMLHTDLCGPIKPHSLGGNLYVLSIIDDFSHYSTVHLISSKSEVTDKIIEFMEKGFNKFGYRPLSIRTDNGGEFCNKELQAYLTKQGTEQQNTIPYTPQENGISERYNRTLMDCTRSLLHQSKLPKSLWGELVSTANYLLNLVKSKNKTATPYELWHQKKPTYSHLKVIGTQCYYLNTNPHKGKLSDRGIAGKLVGYGPSKTFYRIWNPITKKIQVSRTTSFDQANPNTENNEQDELIPLMSSRHYSKDTPLPEVEEAEPIRKSSRNNWGQPPHKLTYSLDGHQQSEAPEWYQTHNLK